MPEYPEPAVRRLKVYAYDPQASLDLESAGFNWATITIPWEEGITPGPVNEYFEVIDVDPASNQFYPAVDLNDRRVLATDGIDPNEGDPRFHQQMAFAVAMRTVKLFEKALGRRVLWTPVWRRHEDYDTSHTAMVNQATEGVAADKSFDPKEVVDAEQASAGDVPKPAEDETRKKITPGYYEYTQRLRIYPHALREPNAYYSRNKLALLFGYFKSQPEQSGASWVFSALSHDIIVHETTHAILDGMHRRYAHATHVDSLAFHEAFSDIVALFSHFTLYDPVYAQIFRSAGRLDQISLLSGLARQFASGIGRHSALREAIDDKTDDKVPRNILSDTITEPHARGAILVAAVFEAFLAIFERRSEDLWRIARVDSAGNGKVSIGAEMAHRLTREAVKAAEHVLRMCVRALDYLPPIDVRFGDFLRAIITADKDLVPVDRLNYRLAMVNAFRRRRIVPDNCVSLAPDSLVWPGTDVISASDELNVDDVLGTGIDLMPVFKFDKIVTQMRLNGQKIWEWMVKSEGTKNDVAWAEALGVFFASNLNTADEIVRTVSHWPSTKSASDRDPRYPAVEVHSVRTTRRIGPDGQDVRQLIIEVTQRRRGFFKADVQATQDDPKSKSTVKKADFTFYGGATLIVDLMRPEIRYVIRKPVDDARRLAQQAAFLNERRELAFSEKSSSKFELFAFLHKGHDHGPA